MEKLKLVMQRFVNSVVHDGGLNMYIFIICISITVLPLH
jgi:hypothetical protein